MRDAMKLGGALFKMMNCHKNKQLVDKSKSFEIWKLHTIVSRKKEEIRKEAKLEFDRLEMQNDNIVIPMG